MTPRNGIGRHEGSAALVRRLAGLLCLVLSLSGFGHALPGHPAVAHEAPRVAATVDAAGDHHGGVHAVEPALLPQDDLARDGDAAQADCADAACCGVCASLIVDPPGLPVARAGHLAARLPEAAERQLSPFLQPPRLSPLA
jgi:hypothetical protein